MSFKCPRCGYVVRNYNVPAREDYQRQWGRAFEVWSKDEFKALKCMYEQGMDILDIAIELERPPNAIAKRIEDLKLKQKKEPEPEPEKPVAESEDDPGVAERVEKMRQETLRKNLEE